MSGILYYCRSRPPWSPYPPINPFYSGASLTFAGTLQYHAVQGREQIVEEYHDVSQGVERQIAKRRDERPLEKTQINI